MALPDQPLTWLGAGAAHLPVLAEIWATVDLERALTDLRGGAVPGAGVASDILEDPLLGARVLVLPPEGGGPRIALVEPSTEGRLAATLARHGEGPVGSYLAAPAALDLVRTKADAAGVRLSRAAIGPFGRSVLILCEMFAARHLILVEPAAVPSPP